MTQQAHFWIYITQKNWKWGLEGHIYAALFMICKSQEVQQPRCPSTDEWISQSRLSVYNRIIIQGGKAEGTAWMTLCRVTSASDKKTRVPSYSTHDGETGSRMQFARGWGVGWRETRNSCLVGIPFQFCKIQQVWEKGGGDGCTTMHTHLRSLICTLRYGCDGQFCYVCFNHNKRMGKRGDNQEYESFQ